MAENKLATCKTCHGSGIVSDGEIYESGGVFFKNGPIKCSKDCPVCRGLGSVNTPDGAAVAQGVDAMTQALAFVRWNSFGECRTAGWNGPPPTASQVAGALSRALATTQPAPCAKCGQIDQGQHGEYHCKACGLATLWDDAQPAPTVAGGVTLPPAFLEFEQFINEPYGIERYDNSDPVREYRHAAYKLWNKVCDAHRAALAATPPTAPSGDVRKVRMLTATEIESCAGATSEPVYEKTVIAKFCEVNGLTLASTGVPGSADTKGGV